MELTNHIITLIGLIFLISVIAAGLSPRLGVPTLLIFVAIGMLAGENGPGGIVYNDVQSAHLAGSLALAVIIFDGGLRTDIGSFRIGLKPAAWLATVGVLITAGIVGLACMWLLDLPLLEALLFGSLVSSTDAAAVFALLKNANLSLHPRVGATLEVESGSNDPMAVFLTIVLLEAVVQQRMPGGGTLLYFVQQMGLGLAGGFAGGWLLARAINKLQLRTALYPLLTLFGGVLIFGVISELGGSGFLAVYLAGLYAGNARVRSMNAILGFNDGIAWLAQIGMFLILGLLITPAELMGYAVPALIISVVLILVARPVAVVLCLLPMRFSWREQTYISWVGLRGAVPIVLAMFPLLAGIEHARDMFNVAFFVVLISLVVQGTSLAPVARWLKLDVRRRPQSRQRVQLDVPGQVNYEVVGYTLETDSAVAGRTLVSLPLPGSVRLIGVLRRGALAPRTNRMRLRAGDHIYLLTPIKYVERLDHVFLAQGASPRDDMLVGDFDVSGQAPLTDLLTLLAVDGLDLDPADTVQKLFERRFATVAEKQWLDLGDYRISVQRTDNGQIVSARVRRRGSGDDDQ
ncbi:MAG TPA: potassium/proton antiporter [Gammaproteobacteria bacterium]